MFTLNALRRIALLIQTWWENIAHAYVTSGIASLVLLPFTWFSSLAFKWVDTCINQKLTAADLGELVHRKCNFRLTCPKLNFCATKVATYTGKIEDGVRWRGWSSETLNGGHSSDLQNQRYRTRLHQP